MIRVCPLSALPAGEAIRVDAERPNAVFHTEEGEVFANDDACTRLEDRAHLRAALRGLAESSPGRDVGIRIVRAVAVLGMNRCRQFGRWRRQLIAAPVPT